MDSSRAPGGLDSLFRPRSIALVGATERSTWSNAAYGNLERLGFTGQVHLVNRKGGVHYGREAATSCAAVGSPIDIALLMVPTAGLEDSLTDLEAAGVRNAVVLTSGFAELGPEGAARQLEIAASAGAKGIRLLGPNCLGFINYVDKTPVWTTPLAEPKRIGSLAVVSQSGATAAMMRSFAQQQGIDLAYVVSTGNEMSLTVADVIDHLVDDEATRSIALFLESVRDAAGFAGAARRALQAGKPIVVLKIGASEVTAASAQAHTGSLVGDDRVFDAACERLGVIRVQSLEDLVFTADLMGRIGEIRGRGVGFVSMSGGVCEIASDRAEAEGLRAEPLAPQTVAALKAALPEFATPQNPLDITGAAMIQPELFEKALTIMGDDPGLGFLVCFFDAPERPESAAYIVRTLGHIGPALAAQPLPSVLMSHTLSPLSDAARQVMIDAGVQYIGSGLHHGLGAIGRAALWWERRRRVLARPTVVQSTLTTARPSGERDVLDHLAGHGVPVIPARMVTNAEEAAEAAAVWDEPVAIKVRSPDIAHKSDVGGVVLGLSGDEAVKDGYARMMQAVAEAAPSARLEGAIVSPMRARGVELFVGVLRDPQWGPVIAVGLGGVLVEALQDTSQRLLPVTADEVLEMFEELRGKRLLDGFRGGPAIDRQAAAAAIAAIGDAALALGPGLAALEVNPLLARGAEIEALDGLAVWND